MANHIAAVSRSYFFHMQQLSVFGR